MILVDTSVLIDLLRGRPTVAAGRDVLSLHFAAARIYFDCRRKGITVRSTIDCFIAALVLEVDGVLLHDDDDFDRIREVRKLATLRG